MTPEDVNHKINHNAFSSFRRYHLVTINVCGENNCESSYGLGHLMIYIHKTACPSIAV